MQNNQNTHQRGENITELEYRRHELLLSDHRPVSALFSVKITKVTERSPSELKLLKYQRPLGLVNNKHKQTNTKRTKKKKNTKA